MQKLPLPVRSMFTPASYLLMIVQTACRREIFWPRKAGADKQSWQILQRMGHSTGANVSYQGIVLGTFYLRFKRKQ